MKCEECELQSRSNPRSSRGLLELLGWSGRALANILSIHAFHPTHECLLVIAFESGNWRVPTFAALPTPVPPFYPLTYSKLDKLSAILSPCTRPSEKTSKPTSSPSR